MSLSRFPKILFSILLLGAVLLSRSQVHHHESGLSVANECSICDFSIKVFSAGLPSITTIPAELLTNLESSFLPNFVFSSIPNNYFDSRAPPSLNS